MFARFKGVLESHIDSQIQQEQARTRNLPSRRSGSPAQRLASRARTTAAGKEKDPSEFENESDGSSVTTLIPSRVGTPTPGEAVPENPLGGGSEPSGKENGESSSGCAGGAGGSGSGNGEKKDVPSRTASPAPGPSSSSSSSSSLSSNVDLPVDVKAKLRKLEKIEGKHNDLLRSYKIVHARSALIEPFEKALRENTPFESIADPKPLIDYISSFSLRADLAREELIRVSKERDEHKSQIQRLKDEQKTKDEEIEILRKEMGASNGTAESSTPGKQQERSSDDIFSFDDEHEKLRTLVEQQEKEIETLKVDLDSTKAAQKAAEEAVEGMQQSVENAQKDLETTRELASARENEATEIAAKAEKNLREMERGKALVEENLRVAEARSKATEEKARVGAEELVEITKALDKKARELEGKKKDLKEKETGLTQAKRALEISKQKISDLEATNHTSNDMLRHLGKLTEELNQLRDGKIVLQRAVVHLEGKLQGSERRLAGNSSKPGGEATPASKGSEPSAAGVAPGAGKNAKKNRKRKGKGKGGAQGSTSTTDEGPIKDSEIIDEELEPVSVPETTLWSESILEDLQNQLVALRSQLDEKDSEIAKFNSSLQWRIDEKEEEIARLRAKLVDVEAVHEEIESLRDDLVNLGQDHMEARDKIKDQAKELHEVRTGKRELEQKVQELESEISALRSQNLSTSAETEKAHATLIAEHESLRQRSSTLQTDLSAAQKLAATRYKDTMELRAVIEKAQPELTSLRAEVATLAAGKNESNQKLVELKRLERSERDLKNDITNLTRKISDKEAELEKMRARVREEAVRRVQAEEATRRAQKDLRKMDDERKEALETADKNTRDHARVQEEVNALKLKIAASEKEIKVLKDGNITLTEELELKVAQYTSSQSLMGSMRDQTGELAMQMKEAVEKYESMEEELTETHKLLSERSREAETMRRLLSEVEDRNSARTRDMKERMEAAFDERDKAEEEAATIGRRRAREIEELRDRVRESERNLKHAEESQAAAERELNGLKDGKFRAEEALERIKREYEDTRKAMASMQDALDQTDNQMEEVERQRAGVRKTLQAEQARSEKLQKSYKALQEEYRQLQAVRPKGIDNNPRSSIDSARSGRASPTSSHANTAGNQTVDMDYLKNVLLQFLEQKDKKTQLQLVPVLRMLLRFDRKDEQRWLAVISAK
ncbi:unnamed protein product [Tuber aestivum]|uniref:GRIP domain-containing protein n=1 Tax=Tuber aestivum TaxID=59557 RepID=A0A292PJX4_9PEZI|nr:unnamed protein product [Tuber aestivum]